MLALLLLACTTPPKPAPVADDPPTGIPGSPLSVLRDLGVRNVVIVEVDTLRRDRLSPYGSPRDTLPRAAAWPHLTLHDHVSATSWTTPSVASLLTGLDAHDHGVLTVDLEVPAQTSAPMVQDLLAEAGIEAALFNGNTGLLGTNLLDGWAETETLDTEPGNGLALVDLGLAWLDGLPLDTPSVLHLRPIDPHRPWSPGIEDRGTFVDASTLPFSYDHADESQSEAVDHVVNSGDDAAIAALEEALSLVYDEELLGVDRALDALLAGLAARGRDQDTLVVLTSDHGETIFERDHHYGHGSTLHEELLHVPLVLFHPALSGDAAPCLTQTWDLYPTLLDLLGAPALSDVRGRSALDQCREEARSSLYRRTGGDRLSYLAVRRGDAVLIADCESATRFGYDHGEDPLELDRLAGDHPNIAALGPSLDDYVAEVLAARPDLSCAGG